MNGRPLGLLACLVALLWSAPALAWGELGHRIICEIAFQELDDPARERVKALIGQDPEFTTFAQACTWADWPRRRAAEHFVNLLRDAAGFGDDPCPTGDECVVSAIEKDLAVLSSASATEQERLEALKYLGHWVGDVHQPLHVSFEDDRGGNGVNVSGGLCRSNLHAAWDGCLLQQDLEGDARSIARDLLREVTDEDRAAWSSSTPIGWANESFLIAIGPEVGTASAPRAGAGTANTTSAWRRGAREGRFGSTSSTSRPTDLSFGSSWSRPGSGSQAC